MVGTAVGPTSPRCSRLAVYSVGAAWQPRAVGASLEGLGSVRPTLRDQAAGAAPTPETEGRRQHQTPRCGWLVGAWGRRAPGLAGVSACPPGSLEACPAHPMALEGGPVIVLWAFSFPELREVEGRKEKRPSG